MNIKRKFYLMDEKNDGKDGGGGTPVVITAEQFAAVQESVEKLEAKNRELLQEKAEAKKAAEKAIEEAARKNGDVEALETSWKAKLASETAERDGRLSEYQQMINRMTIGTEAQRLASALAVPGSADVLLPHIERRLQVEIKDGVPIVRVLDKNGKPSALSIDDLSKEIASTAAFAPLIVGSMASGPGHVGTKGQTGGGTMKRADFDALSPIKKAAAMAELKKNGGKIID
jgi:hypothetical protein